MGMADGGVDDGCSIMLMLILIDKSNTFYTLSKRSCYCYCCYVSYAIRYTLYGSPARPAIYTMCGARSVAAPRSPPPASPPPGPRRVGPRTRPTDNSDN